MANRKRDHAREEAGRKTVAVKLRLTAEHVALLDEACALFRLSRSGMVARFAMLVKETEPR